MCLACCVEWSPPDMPRVPIAVTSWRGGSPKAVRIKRMHLKLQAGNQTKPSQTTAPMAHLRAANLKGRPSEPPWSHEPFRGASLPKAPPPSASVPRATCNSRDACSKHRSDLAGNPGFCSRGSRGCHGTPLQKNHKHRMPANLVELAPSSNCGHRGENRGPQCEGLRNL